MSAQVACALFRCATVRFASLHRVGCVGAAAGQEDCCRCRQELNRARRALVHSGHEILCWIQVLSNLYPTLSLVVTLQRAGLQAFLKLQPWRSCFASVVHWLKLRTLAVGKAPDCHGSRTCNQQWQQRRDGVVGGKARCLACRARGAPAGCGKRGRADEAGEGG